MSGPLSVMTHLHSQSQHVRAKWIPYPPFKLYLPQNKHDKLYLTLCGDNMSIVLLFYRARNKTRHQIQWDDCESCSTSKMKLLWTYFCKYYQVFARYIWHSTVLPPWAEWNEYWQCWLILHDSSFYVSSIRQLNVFRPTHKANRYTVTRRVRLCTRLKSKLLWNVILQPHFQTLFSFFKVSEGRSPLYLNTVSPWKNTSL